MKILSTKKLKPNQRDLLLGADFSVVDYDAIGIEFLNFEIPTEVKNVIFTSQNGVKAFLKQISLLLSPSESENFILNIEKVFCVGQKTKALLEKNGLKVTQNTNYGSELAYFIVENYKNHSFHFFCGSIRREEIPIVLKDNKIEFIEIKTYKTTLIPRRFDQKWDGILFFSPSGVDSFVSENNLENTTAFCIGTTTAAAALKHTELVVIAHTASVESVIAKAAKTLKNYD